MNFLQKSTLAFVHRINHPKVSLVCLPYFKILLGNNSQEIQELMHSPIWQARWVATQKITQCYSTEESRDLLFQLAEDSERNVREGAAHGLGMLLVKDSQILNDYKKILTDIEVSENLRRAVLHSAVVLWRQSSKKIQIATELLTVGAGEFPQGCFRTIGSHLVAVELRKTHPSVAEELLKQWSVSTNNNLQYHAGRMKKQNITLLKSKKINMNWTNTSQIKIPSNIFDQVIGQEEAVEIVKIAIKQERFVMFVGEPGTGKSMLAKAMAEQYYVSQKLQDIAAIENPKSSINPIIKTLPAGEGEKTIQLILERQKNAVQTFNFLWGVVFIGIVTAGSTLSFIHKTMLYPMITVIILWVLWQVKKRFTFNKQKNIPHLLISHSKGSQRKFVDATGFQTASLLGDVRHDPFQSGGRETPSHMLLAPGAIHMAHKGILFIDEMSSLSMENQQHLLTAIQEKQFPIMGRSMGSSGGMVRSQPVPCDFILCLAGDKNDVKKLHPALQSRIDGFGYTIMMQNEMADTEANRQKIAQFIAQEVIKDGKIPHFSKEAVNEIIKQAKQMSKNKDSISLRLRELGGIIRRSGDVASLEDSSFVETQHIHKALKIKPSKTNPSNTVELHL